MTDNRVNEPTAEQIIEDALRNSYASGSALARLIVSDLHAHGLLSEGAPSEQQVELAARAIRADYVQRYPEEPPVYHAGAGQPVWRHMARAALTAAGVAPQEPSQTETKSGNNSVSLDRTP